MGADKAYKDRDFMMSREARTIRILAEYLEPQARFQRYGISDTVVFFGSARALPMDKADEQLKQAEREGDAAAIDQARRRRKLAGYYEDARRLAFLLTQWSKKLEADGRRFIVCSGGGPGIMEAANRGASEAAGVSIGLGISLPEETTANPYITRELLFEFHYFFTRKFWFVYPAKALVVFPGGFGTMDELFELLTLIQTGKIGKSLPIVLYGREFWEGALNFQTLLQWGTISKEDLRLFRIESSPEEAFEYHKGELTRLYLTPDSGNAES